MEQPTPRTTAVVPWLLLLCLVCRAPQARAQPDHNDFISIDCGLPGETGYRDNTTSLYYTTDAGFIDTNAGINHNISAQYINPSIPTSLHSVRSFPSGERNCYTLGSLVSGFKYLIRGQFLYGNYDGFNRLPIFDLYIGVNFWTTVNISSSDAAVYAEAIMVVPEDSVQVCLKNTDRGVPFISGLDLRPLTIKLYPLANETQALVLLHRFNFGPTDETIIRYPYDPYDRIWFPFVDMTDWAEIKTGEKVKIDDELFQPPEAVMQTAVTPQLVSKNIEFTLDLQSFPSDLGYIHMLYFCELEHLPTNALREYNFYRNDVLRHSNYTPPYLVNDCIYSSEPFQVDQYKVSLNATTMSTLPPIINAIELFAVIPTTIQGTDTQDVSAITAIKEIYQVHKNWMGDPCIPKALCWDGLTCSYDVSKPPKIRNVNMSFNGLHGGISPNFANLKDVQYLDLSNNNLTGSIPDTLSRIQSLIFLDLSNNNLNGSIPYGLIKKIQDGSLDLRYVNNPDLCTNGNSCQLAEGRTKLAIYIAVSVVVIVVLVLVAVLCFCFQRKRKQGSINYSVKLTSDGDGNSSLRLENRRFTYMELETITNNFERVLGQGGFGHVFHGSLEDGTQVAVKLRSHSSNQGVKQFLAEAQVLTRIHHKNLVSMIGYCKDGVHMALVYEYMPQGTLQEHIAREDNKGRGLPWRQRLRVALESAQGLEYLHKGCSPPIIHRDVKTANILLNARLEAKIADFGLSKAFTCDDNTHVSTNTFVGTHGYVDPEYQRTMHPSTKSDVYSFGVVLLELVTGKPAILRKPRPINIINWARQLLARGDIEGIVDARMQGDHDINAVWKTTNIALMCTEQAPAQRPSMTEVVMQLQECLDLEEGNGGSGMNPHMGYNATINQSISVSQNNTMFETAYNYTTGPPMDSSPASTR
ncbi:putative leucine-rich repeat receptor-like protein kinase At2g19210 [Aegilops tauschii subsp. strangulata]|uniref:non-specific serine/threonine protein kinase n=3 Tax=Aegilops tauschii subsp. strangulata TaxID=200361 RepID=A0A453MIY7_AEGTS|nr:putative leucine-rich repeat receptor-like protein kinase At2g19210 [Aegilops tauschii subsp. strangulata]